MNKKKYILTELLNHLPYSIFGVCLGIVLTGILTFIAVLADIKGMFAVACRDLFHVFHATHLLLSSVATTAMFWKHDDRNPIKAVTIGGLGSVSICGLSDIVFPYLGGIFLHNPMEMHICIIEEPGLVLPFVSVGVIAGLTVTRTFEKSTEYSHSAHVFISSVASILYLLSYGMTGWVHQLGGVFIVTILAVMIPCCLSDIAFPLACTHRHCQHTNNRLMS